ncbi:NUDIX domain protein, partial [Vibrio parahaemolyticus V-223/04]
WAINSTVKKRI